MKYSCLRNRGRLFIAEDVAIAATVASCHKETTISYGIQEEGEILFGAEGLLMDLQVETKATEVTPLSSFYVSAVTGAAGNELSAWFSTLFSQMPASKAGK